MAVNEIKETGGARIGMARASWPFATLIVNRDTLRLNAGMIGDLIFSPSDIISLEPYNVLVSQGIRINHNVSNYNKDVVFLTSGINTLIEEIRQTGFLDNKEAVPINRDIKALQSSGGFPFKWPPVIAIIVIWNLLFIADNYKFFTTDQQFTGFGIFVKIALGMMFLICALILFLKPMQAFMLKKGRTIDGVRPFLYFMMFVVGMMLLMTSVLP